MGISHKGNLKWLINLTSNVINPHEKYETQFMLITWVKTRNWTKPGVDAIWRNGDAGGKASHLDPWKDSGTHWPRAVQIAPLSVACE